MDLAPLAALPKLRKLRLFGIDQADLTSLAGKSGLTVYVGNDTQLVGAELLGPDSVLDTSRPKLNRAK